MSNLKEIALLGKKPLPEGTPEFSEIKYDDNNYRKLKKIFAPTNYDDKNWDDVINLAEIIFSQKTKHIQVLQWLCEGLVNVHNYLGLECGLNILHDLIESDINWLIVEPKDFEKRTLFIIAFDEKIDNWLIDVTPSENELDSANNSFLKIESIDKLLDERYLQEDNFPASLTKLKNKLKPYKIKKMEEVKEVAKESMEDATEEILPSPKLEIKKQELVTPILISVKNAEEKVSELINQYKLDEGLTICQESYNKSSSQRERFLWKLALVILLYEHKEIALASFHLVILEEMISTYKLEEWDAEFSIKVAELFLMCEQEDKKLVDSGKCNNARTRLQKLDIARFLKYNDQT